MTSYQQYPTPPPTSSPKYSASQQPESRSHDYEAHEPSPFTRAQTFPAQSGTNKHKIPAQDSYYFSEPNSPIHETQPTAQFAPKPSQARPPRRRSSPLLTGPGGVQYNQPSRPFSPPKPYSPSGLNRLSPRPLHSSPLNPAPSPYSAGRPKPRPGFVQRMAIKVQEWIKAFIDWIKKNPILAGILTFVPVLTIALVMRISKGLRRGMSHAGSQFGNRKKVGGLGGAGTRGIAARGLKAEHGILMDGFKTLLHIIR